MKHVFLFTLFSLFASLGFAQEDTTKIILVNAESGKQSHIKKRDYLKMKTADGELYYGAFRKFKDAKIYTNLDTVDASQLSYIKVNTYKQQKTSSAYTAFGIAAVLNLVGFQTAFSEIREEESTNNGWLFGLGLGTAVGSITTGIILYNYYDTYNLKGDKIKWTLKLD